MKTISLDPNLTTLINVFTVEPANQQKLVTMLEESTESTIRKLKGWVSTHLLTSKDRSRVIVYSQWESPNDIEAMRKDANLVAYFPKILALATFESIVCDSSYGHHCSTAA